VSISRPVCAAVSAIVIALGVSACGSDSNSSSTANAGAGANPPGNGQGGFLQDPKVVACLKKQGVTLPSGGRRGNGGPPNGQPPTGTDGQPPTGTDGQPPTGTNRRPPSGQGAPNGPGSAQFQKLRAALQKCGVDFRGQPPNGQAPQDQGTTTPSAN
jgi:hypothetical protein